MSTTLNTRTIIFALTPLIVLLLLTELGLRVVYFNVVSSDQFATVATAKYLKRKIMLAQAARLANEPQTRIIKDALYTESGGPLLAKLKQDYEANFRQLADTAKQIDSKLVIIYLPVYYDPSTTSSPLRLRPFYRDLAVKYQVEFLDLTDYLSGYEPEQIYLIPENAHFSRYGNQLIAAQLHNYLLLFRDYSSSRRFTSRPKLFGDLKPNQSNNWIYDPRMPYQVATNSQGLRLKHDLEFPKQKQRILILGDSYTFGPYLPNHDTYPDLLDKRYPEAEIINAGIAGYTITDEASLFTERAKFLEPDITILQISENDISGLLSFKKNRFDRHRQVYSLTPEESKLLQNIQENDHNNQ